MEDHAEFVARKDIEGLWESVRMGTRNPREGIFGPLSVSWKVNRESALFLGAGRASLLQLAHPWVATALDQHSNLRSDPLARFHNTFRVVFTMIFGTLDQVLAASRHLYNLHTRIQGKLPEAVGAHARESHYRANEVNALIWVYATLIESALVAYSAVLPALSDDEREAYYRESKTMAALFGIPAAALPANWKDFEAYIAAMVESGELGVTSMSRDMAHRVLHGKGSWVPIPRWYRALTAEWVPERLRREFGLECGEQNRKSVARARERLPRLYRRLPAALRFAGPYREAQHRLAGTGVDVMTRASNRFWMGQTRMMFAELAG
jgi:uncharacterized protein (DUF2236 family)